MLSSLYIRSYFTYRHHPTSEFILQHLSLVHKHIHTQDACKYTRTYRTMYNTVVTVQTQSRLHACLPVGGHTQNRRVHVHTQYVHMCNVLEITTIIYIYIYHTVTNGKYNIVLLSVFSKSLHAQFLTYPTTYPPTP